MGHKVQRKEYNSLINTLNVMNVDRSILDLTVGTLGFLSILMRKPRAKSAFLSPLQDCQQ